MSSTKTMGDDTRQKILDGGVNTISVLYQINGGEMKEMVSASILESTFHMGKIEENEPTCSALFAMTQMAERPLTTRLVELATTTKGE